MLRGSGPGAVLQTGAVKVWVQRPLDPLCTNEGDCFSVRLSNHMITCAVAEQYVMQRPGPHLRAKYGDVAHMIYCSYNLVMYA